MIALENLVIALLSQASPQQLDLAREMATYISPRPGFTPHPLTIHAAAQMVHLVDRAVHVADPPLPERPPQGDHRPMPHDDLHMFADRSVSRPDVASSHAARELGASPSAFPQLAPSSSTVCVI